MLEILGQISISEVILLFVLLFVIPINFVMIRRLRQYERMLGEPPPPPKKAAPPPPPPAAAAPSAPPGVYPYQAKAFLTPPELACLAALREALGDDVDVFPKVALWEHLESTDRNPAFADRLKGLDYDFLVCDKSLGQPMTAVMFKPGKGRPAGGIDELKKCCAAAGANLVFIDMAEQCSAASLKKELGIPDLDL